jgi:hypothetical protein
MTSAFSVTLLAALVLAAFVAADAKGPSITNKVHPPLILHRADFFSFTNECLRYAQVYFDISIGGEPAGRITMGLYDCARP